MKYVTRMTNKKKSNLYRTMKFKESKGRNTWSGYSAVAARPCCVLEPRPHASINSRTSVLVSCMAIGGRMRAWFLGASRLLYNRAVIAPCISTLSKLHPEIPQSKWAIARKTADTMCVILALSLIVSVASVFFFFLQKEKKNIKARQIFRQSNSIFLGGS